jgi:hypothetical protein
VGHVGQVGSAAERLLGDSVGFTNYVFAAKFMGSLECTNSC